MTTFAFRLPALILFAALPATLSAQAPPQGPAPSTLPATAATSDTAGSAPSAVLAPAVGQIRQALATLRPDKWKTPGAVAQETASNISSIQRDLDNTLPGLLASADRNPASVADVLPAYRNIEALYDVLLRVTEISKLSAPSQQSSALQQATGSLDDARRNLGDRLQVASAAQNHAITSLQAQLRTAQNSAIQTAAVPACTPQPPTAKRRSASKAKPKPAASPSNP
ncbi:MAG: hypothetical protein NVSMB62_15710 [Acidobacteriaceae bacterium]